jgi:hypothetical protein
MHYRERQRAVGQPHARPGERAGSTDHDARSRRQAGLKAIRTGVRHRYATAQPGAVAFVFGVFSSAPGYWEASAMPRSPSGSTRSSTVPVVRYAAARAHLASTSNCPARKGGSRRCNSDSERKASPERGPATAGPSP